MLMRRAKTGEHSVFRPERRSLCGFSSNSYRSSDPRKVSLRRQIVRPLLIWGLVMGLTILLIGAAVSPPAVSAAEQNSSSVTTTSDMATSGLGVFALIVGGGLAIRLLTTKRGGFSLGFNGGHGS